MSAPARLVVSVHDVAPPHADRVRRMLDLLASIGVERRSLLAIPNYHGQSPIDRDDRFCAWLRACQHRGDEIVLHGYEHIGVGAPTTMRERFENRWSTQGEGEFLSLDYAQAADRIQRGLTLAARVGLEVRGFVAPAWLINRDGLRAARDLGCEYTNSYLGIADLRSGRSYFAPSLVFGPGHLNEDLGISLQARASAALDHCPTVRVVLHPPCIDHPARMARIVSLIERQLRSHRPVTYWELLGSLRASPLNEASGVGAQ